jgi:Phospholipase_D-nuclease N-terminal
MNNVLVPFLIFSVVIAGLWLWSLIHCIMNKRLSDSNRMTGILLIVLLGVLGSIIYIFLPRNSAAPRYGARSSSRIQRGRTTARIARSAGSARAGSTARTTRGIRR